MDHRKPASRTKVLAFVAGLANVVRHDVMKQSAIAEMLAILAFGSDRPGKPA